MDEFHRQIADEQRREGVRVIPPPHALGFLDPDLPEKSRPLDSGNIEPLPSVMAEFQG